MCNNTKGSYNCTCKEGFTGDGFKCSTGETITKFVVVSGLSGYVSLYVYIYIYIYMYKRLIDGGDLKTKVRISFIVLATSEYGDQIQNINYIVVI